MLRYEYDLIFKKWKENEFKEKYYEKSLFSCLLM